MESRGSSGSNEAVESVLRQATQLERGEMKAAGGQ